jgi:heptosyltransferase-3
VIHGLRLLDTTEIPKIRDLVPPDCAAADENSLGQLLPLAGVQNAYAVIHLYPRNLYKAWTPEGWKSVIQHLVSRGMAVVVTGGHGPDEQKHLRDVLEGDSSDQVVNLAGQLSLPQVSALLGGASLYVGPDTGITHLAAAHGIPTAFRLHG